MRKNTQRALKAFVEGGRYRNKHDHVIDYEWRLHGNRIAYFEGDQLVLNSCTWLTNTTKDRLNALLGHYADKRIVQYHSWWYVGDIRWSGSWVIPFDFRPKGHPKQGELL